jgi:hypothetical protein
MTVLRSSGTVRGFPDFRGADYTNGCSQTKAEKTGGAIMAPSAKWQRISLQTRGFPANLAHAPNSLSWRTGWRLE